MGIYLRAMKRQIRQFAYGDLIALTYTLNNGMIFAQVSG